MCSMIIDGGDSLCVGVCVCVGGGVERMGVRLLCNT